MAESESQTLAIEVEGVAKTYGGGLFRAPQPALRGLSLSVRRGAAFGLIGPNGAGKTTFIKILLGVVRPSAGEVKVLGGSPEDPSVRARIGYLPERLHLPASWSALAFLQSVSRLKHLAIDDAALVSLLSRVGLTEAIHRRIGGFSKGMRQRLGLAAALLGEPDLLVLDEPTDGIDPLGRVEIRKILQDELARGATLFLNSHLLAETERVCGQIAILAHGQLVRQGALEELTRVSRRWVLRFADGADVSALAAVGFVPSPGGAWTLDAEDAVALNAALDKARTAGALVIEISRERNDLEQVLADAVKVAA